MLFIELINNVALLIALAALYQVIASRNYWNQLSQKFIFGILFGAVGVVGMMTPLTFGSGIIFDGRSIILFVAGCHGGPLVAIVSALVIGSYRVWLGGSGIYVGIAVITMSSLIGVFFYYYKRRTGVRLTAFKAYAAGFLLHALVLITFLFLPAGVGFKIVKEIGLTIILFYPIGTALVCLLFQDYDEKEASRANLHRLAYYDSLTSLPNRLLLINSVNNALSSWQESGQKSALLVLGVDRLTTLNDARGHRVGDMLLCGVADRLRKIIDPRHVLARMSGGEFSVLLKGNLRDSEDIDLTAKYFADEIQISLRHPINLGEIEISIFTSIGFTSFPQAPDDVADDILKRAYTALHQAKRNGGNQCVIFEQSMSRLAEQKFQIERELKFAISSGQLRLFLQSQVNSSGAIVGAEALIRWQHPERGLVAPSLFIPIAEETDLIIDIGIWVLNETCKILASDELCNLPIRISVNMSPRHFRQPNFASSIKRILVETGAKPTQLALEITESLVIQDMGDIVAKMTELTSLGIYFSLDDFGTGYASLSQLINLPIHELKIDKTFVQNAPNDKDNAILVDSILAVAQHMNLRVVAEGVETIEQANFFNARADVTHQGYLYGKPEPSNKWIRNLPSL